MKKTPKAKCDMELLKKPIEELVKDLMDWMNRHTYSTLNQPAEPPKTPELPKEVKDKMTVA